MRRWLIRRRRRLSCWIFPRERILPMASGSLFERCAALWLTASESPSQS